MFRHLAVLLFTVSGCQAEIASRPTDLASTSPTIDSPYTTAQIELVTSATRDGWRGDFYRNRAYTCGKPNADGSEAYQTFLVGYPEKLAAATQRPLWVRMHGGGTGAFQPDHGYQPAIFETSLDEEHATELAQLGLEPGLVARMRNDPAGFRFVFPSMCDHDLYSGVGLPEADDPYSPDALGEPRAADGLLAAKAAIRFTRDHYATAHIVLHGSSAGSIGAFSVAYTLGRAGTRLSGIVMDSFVLDERLAEIEVTGCTAYTGLGPSIQRKIGPMADPQNTPAALVSAGKVFVPMLHIWDRGDPTCCGETTMPGTTLGKCDYLHDPLRQAIAAAPPGGIDRAGAPVSINARLCVDDPALPNASCDMHSPTKIESIDTDHQVSYNPEFERWVTARLADQPVPDWPDAIP